MLAGVYNIIWVANKMHETTTDNVPFLVEACIYLALLAIEVIVSVFFIYTVRGERSALWPYVKIEVSRRFLFHLI